MVRYIAQGHLAGQAVAGLKLGSPDAQKEGCLSEKTGTMSSSI